MKRIITIITLTIIAFSINAQDKSYSTSKFKIHDNPNYNLLRRLGAINVPRGEHNGNSDFLFFVKDNYHVNYTEVSIEDNKVKHKFPAHYTLNGAKLECRHSGPVPILWYQYAAVFALKHSYEINWTWYDYTKDKWCGENNSIKLEAKDKSNSMTVVALDNIIYIFLKHENDHKVSIYKNDGHHLSQRHFSRLDYFIPQFECIHDIDAKTIFDKDGKEVLFITGIHPDEKNIVYIKWDGNSESSFYDYHTIKINSSHKIRSLRCIQANDGVKSNFQNDDVITFLYKRQNYSDGHTFSLDMFDLRLSDGQTSSPWRVITGIGENEGCVLAPYYTLNNDHIKSYLLYFDYHVENGTPIVCPSDPSEICGYDDIDYIDVVKIPSNIIKSVNPEVNDMALVSDTMHPESKKLWNLIGIIEGAPPTNVNCPELWNMCQQQSPTTLSIEYSSTQYNIIKQKTTNSFNVKTAGKITKLLGISYAFSLSSVISNSKDSTSIENIRISNTIYMEDSNAQQKGYLVYLIPRIIKNTYKIYSPDGNTELLYPPQTIAFSLDSKGHTLAFESYDLKNTLSGISDPANLLAWNNRPFTLSQEGFINDIPWSNNPVSVDISLSNTSIVSKTTTSQTAYGSKINIPFFDLDDTYTIDFSNTITTEFNNNFTAHVKNPVFVPDSFPNSHPHYNTQWFWLRPDETNHTSSAYTWYLQNDIIQNNSYPWLMGWSVSTSLMDVNNGYPGIQLLTPHNTQELTQGKNLFSWENNLEFENYYFQILKKNKYNNLVSVLDTLISKKSITIHTSSLNLSEDYFWSVIGITKDNDYYYADKSMFSTPQIFSQSDSILNLNNQQNIELFAYPNPAKNYFNIEITLKTPKSITLEFYDLSGRLIRQKELQKYSMEHKTNWNLCDESGRKVNKGFYILKARTDSALECSKLIVL